MNTTEIFLIALFAIFTIPFCIWRLGRTEYYAPLVVVQIITGVLLGPGILGAIFPDLYKFIFNSTVISSLNGIAWWGVCLFVFMAGIELNLKHLRSNTKDTVVTAGLALGMPLVLGSFAAMFLLNWDGWLGPRAQEWQFILGIGMASAVTALPILILLMEKLQIFRQPLGQRILRYASLDDIAIWSVLAIILMDWVRLEQQAMFLICFAVSSLLFRKFIIKVSAKDRIYIALIWLTIVAWGADWAGLHFMIGAFLAGAVIDSEWFDQEFLDNLRAMVLLLMMPIFFLSTGLKTNWQMGGIVVILAATFMFAAQLSGKLLGIWTAGKILKWNPGEWQLLGWLLQTKALIEIIFVNVLLDKGIITNQMFTVMLLMAIVSTMATIPMVTPILNKVRNLIKKDS